MSRIITQPSEATPQIFIITNDNNAVGYFIGPLDEGFTAAECAQIARAYAQQRVYKSNLTHEAIDAEVDKWESLFTQWETKTR